MSFYLLPPGTGHGPAGRIQSSVARRSDSDSSTELLYRWDVVLSHVMYARSLHPRGMSVCGVP